MSKMQRVMDEFEGLRKDCSALVGRVNGFAARKDETPEESIAWVLARNNRKVGLQAKYTPEDLARASKSMDAAMRAYASAPDRQAAIARDKEWKKAQTEYGIIKENTSRYGFKR